MVFTENELIAGKCWLDRNFPNVEEVDITYLKIRFDMPNYAEDYIRKKWFLKHNIKKPFKNSEIYSKTAASSSSSLYTE